MVDDRLTVLIKPHVDMSAKFDITGVLWLAYLPYISILQPDIRYFHLLVVFDLLLEKTILITNAVSVPGKVQGCEGIQKAGSQTAETAVAKTGVRLHYLDRIDVDAKIGQSVLDNVVDTKIHQIVRQQSSDQEFHGKVIHFLFLLFFDDLFGVHPVDTGIVTHHLSQHHVFLRDVRLFDRTAVAFDDTTLKLFYEFLLVFEFIEFAIHRQAPFTFAKAFIFYPYLRDFANLLTGFAQMFSNADDAAFLL